MLALFHYYIEYDLSFESDLISYMLRWCRIWDGATSRWFSRAIQALVTLRILLYFGRFCWGLGLHTCILFCWALSYLLYLYFIFKLSIRLFYYGQVALCFIWLLVLSFRRSFAWICCTLVYPSLVYVVLCMSPIAHSVSIFQKTERY